MSAAQLAVENDGTNPHNWAMLGSIYSVLVPQEVEGAYDRARGAFESARALDPHNPSRTLALARLAFAAGDEEAARAFAQEAIGQKQNYVDAMLFLAQVDIAAGNTEGAIAAAEAVTTLEPQNPVRFFQLGVLQLANDAVPAATASFERAIALNSNFADARYYLAVAYDEQGRSDDAREQINHIAEQNAENPAVIEALRRLDAGEPLVDAPEAQPGVSDEGVVNETGDSVTTDNAPDTPLVTPVNTPSDEVRAE